MYTDALLQLDSANASIRAAATYLSTNTIDLSQNRDIGSGAPLRMLYNIDVAFTGGTSIQPEIITSASANLSAPTVLTLGTVILEAALTLGAMFVQFIPELTGATLAPTGQRFLGVQYVGVGTHTLGSISARIVNDVQDVKAYPSGFTIL